MDELMLFTDGSVNIQSKIGYGAYLAVFDQELSLESLRKNIKVNRFEQTSSTKLELQTLLWALSDIQCIGCKVVVHTDSQNIIGLPGRRERLEKNEYRSKNNKLLNNYELYQARHATSRNFGTPVAIIHSPTQRMGDALAALRPSQLRTKPCSVKTTSMAGRLFGVQFFASLARC